MVRAPLSALAEPLTPPGERRIDDDRLLVVLDLDRAGRFGGVGDDLRQRILDDPPVAVVLLEQLVEEGRRLVGRRDPDGLEEAVQGAEVGRDEIVLPAGLHRDEGGAAGRRRRQEPVEQGLQLVRALGRRRLVAGERGRGGERRAEDRARRAPSGGGRKVADMVGPFRSRRRRAPTLSQFRSKRA